MLRIADQRPPNLVSEHRLRRDIEAEGRGNLVIHHELKLGRLNDRQIIALKPLSTLPTVIRTNWTFNIEFSLDSLTTP